MASMLTEPAAPPIGTGDPGGDALYEIVDGQRVELPPMSAYASRVTFRLGYELARFANEHNLGEAVTEVLFRLPLEQSRNRRPDVAFVSYERWPKGRPQPTNGNAWDVVPDLAAEVISPNDLADEIQEKIEEYFRADVRLVWVVYPVRRVVYVYESLTQVSVRRGMEELEGGQVLPGLRLSLAKVFPEAAAPPVGETL